MADTFLGLWKWWQVCSSLDVYPHFQDFLFISTCAKLSMNGHPCTSQLSWARRRCPECSVATVEHMKPKPLFSCLHLHKRLELDTVPQVLMMCLFFSQCMLWKNSEETPLVKVPAWRHVGLHCAAAAFGTCWPEIPEKQSLLIPLSWSAMQSLPSPPPAPLFFSAAF